MRIALSIGMLILGALLAACPTNNVCCSKFDCPGANICSVPDCTATGNIQGRCVYSCQVDRDCANDEVCNQISAACGCIGKPSPTACGTCSGCSGN